ncbi:hypothetical protein [Polluticoccus soli]|uniref:gliding motility lipoprotein GldB n=1 Tax=Polluticoccus soli TaxID=3034150 RepID=UPI0023E2B932|nr:hypothetical protein [Flavipsychrobacter sp. JY13-12]
MFKTSPQRKFGVRTKIIQLLSTALLLSLVGLTGCGGDEEKAPDVSDVKVDLKTYRFDKDLAAIDTNNVGGSLAQLQQKYPQFLNFYLDTLMGFGILGNYSNDNPAVSTVFRPYLLHKDYRGLFDTVAKHYPDTKEIDEQLTKGFKYLKHYLPSTKEPKVMYMITWLGNWAAITYEDMLGIGLDMFLGPQYPYYKSRNIPDYMTAKMTKEYIPVAVFRAIYQDKAPFKMEGANMLDMMIQRGKELYFLGKVLPFLPEHLRLAYTSEQLEWCKQNEGQVYNFFVQENLLYDNNWQKILRYVNDGPSSAGMAPESPGNTGSWIGLQIVKAYMAQHSDMTLEQLMKERKDAQRFLQESRYKPK